VCRGATSVCHCTGLPHRFEVRGEQAVRGTPALHRNASSLAGEAGGAGGVGGAGQGGGLYVSGARGIFSSTVVANAVTRGLGGQVGRLLRGNPEWRESPRGGSIRRTDGIVANTIIARNNCPDCTRTFCGAARSPQLARYRRRRTASAVKRRPGGDTADTAQPPGWEALAQQWRAHAHHGPAERCPAIDWVTKPSPIHTDQRGLERIVNLMDIGPSSIRPIWQLPSGRTNGLRWADNSSTPSR